MPQKPVYQRDFRVFISHSSKDKDVVNQLYYWLKEVCGIKKIWYDSDEIYGGDAFIKNLEEGIPAAQSFILMYSKNVSQSPWVRREIERALNHQAEFPQYRIIPISLDNTPLDGFLSEFQALQMPNGELNLEFCRKLLRALYPGDLSLDSGETKDIYVSYGWHESEQAFTQKIAQLFLDERFRLIGDAKDQPNFKGREDKDRISDIMLSCRGFLAILPYRPNSDLAKSGYTSKYILKEIDMAIELRLPIILIKDPRVDLNEKYIESALSITEFSMEQDFRNTDTKSIRMAVRELNENLLKETPKEHFVFYATDIRTENALRNKAIREIIQRVTGMPCKFGEAIHERHDIYRVIIEQIKHSFVMIADLTEYRPNILIEAGIAIGADVHVYYVQSGEVHRPPVMLGHPQVHPYSTDAELLGKIHQIIYPYRRSILNYELGS